MQRTSQIHDNIDRDIAEFDLATRGMFKPSQDYTAIQLKPQVCALLDQYASAHGIGRDLAANELLRACLEGA